MKVSPLEKRIVDRRASLAAELNRGVQVVAQKEAELATLRAALERYRGAVAALDEVLAPTEVV